MWRSSTPSVCEPTTIWRSSSSVTSSREALGSPPSSRTATSVDLPRNQITGRAMRAIRSTSGASASAKPSARCIASRLLVSSPSTMEK